MHAGGTIQREEKTFKIGQERVKAAYSFDHKAKTMQRVRQALGQAIESLLE